MLRHIHIRLCSL